MVRFLSLMAVVALLATAAIGPRLHAMLFPSH